MFDRFIVVLFQVITLFMMSGVGFILGRLKIITEHGTKELSNVIIRVSTPCIILNTFQMDYDRDLLVLLGTGTLAILGSYIVFILVSKLFFRKKEEGTKAILQFGCVYGNVGSMGIPLITAVLGSSHVIFAVLGVAVFNLIIYTHGAMLMGGRKAVSARNLATNMVVIALVVGLICMFLRIRFPEPIFNALTYLGNLNSPLFMLIIGAQLSRADFRTIFTKPLFYAVCAIKQLLIPLIAALLLVPFHLDKEFYVAIIILFGTPVATSTGIFAERYGRNVAYAAQLVSLSTLLSILTLPVIAVMAEYLTTLW